MGNDVLQVHRVTADQPAASNGIVAKGPILIHKVMIQSANTTALCFAKIFDAATATGTERVVIGSNQFGAAGPYAGFVTENFLPPLRIQSGLSLSVSGVTSVDIYYSR